MNGVLDYYGWREWPFQVVAESSGALLWADRQAFKGEIDKRLRRVREIPHSTVQLMWADLGAGKTHTLRYIENSCRGADPAKLVAVYSEMPSGIDGFVGLYRQFIGAFDEESLRTLADGASTTLRSGVSQTVRDLRQALQVVKSGDPTALGVVFEWLQANPGKPHLNVLKQYGIGARIGDDQSTMQIVAAMIRLLNDGASGRAIIWLIDEFQRVSDIPMRRRDSFGNALVSLFNSCPRGLHLVLSCSVAVQSTARSLVPAALMSRAASFPILELPNLTPQDCLIFLQDLFSAVRLRPSSLPSFPLSEDAVARLLDRFELAGTEAVTPRSLMAAVEAVLYERYTRAGDTAPLPIGVNEIDSLLDASGRT